VTNDAKLIMFSAAFLFRPEMMFVKSLLPTIYILIMKEQFAMAAFINNKIFQRCFKTE
jgi:hypothetical protein